MNRTCRSCHAPIKPTADSKRTRRLCDRCLVVNAFTDVIFRIAEGMLGPDECVAMRARLVNGEAVLEVWLRGRDGRTRATFTYAGIVNDGSVMAERVIKNMLGSARAASE